MYSTTRSGSGVFYTTVMKKFTSPTQKTGEIGERVAEQYLQKQGYHITDRNVTRRVGELDLVVEKDGIWYGVEVKSVAIRGRYEPYPVWQNLTTAKRTKMRKTLALYARETGRDLARAAMLGVMVYLHMNTRRARVELVEILH